MAAFSYQKYSYMNNSISVLFRRMASHLEYDMTRDDFVHLFIPEDLRDMAVRAPQLFELPYRKSHVDVKVPLGEQTVQFMLSVNESHGNPAPLLPKKQATPDLADHRFDSVRKYLQEYAELARQFGVAKRVLYELNEQCNSEQQLRYLYPTCLILLDNTGDDKCKEAADKLRAVKTPKTFPFLPEWMRQGCRESAGIITAASMIADKQAVPREVSIGVKHVTRFDYHGQAIEPMIY